MRKAYTKEFREQALKLVTEQGLSPRRAARELGMPDSTLMIWLKKSGWHFEPQAPQLPLSTDPQALQLQVRELQRQVRRLEMEKDILKKATVYFASQSP